MRSLNRKARPIACNPWIDVRSLYVFEHDLRANPFGVCREGKPVPTFPDHARYRRCGGDVAGSLINHGFTKADANMVDDWLRGMIRKSGHRFFEKIMLEGKDQARRKLVTGTPPRAAMAGSGRRRSGPRPRGPSSASTVRRCDTRPVRPATDRSRARLPAGCRQ